MVCQTTKRLTPKHIGEERAGWFTLTALMIVSVMLSLSSSQCLRLACIVWLWYFLILLTYFCCFWSSFTPGKQIGKPGAAVQCRKSRYWNKASPWNWWCDCKNRFWQMYRKKWICIFPDISDIEWPVQFSCDNIAKQHWVANYSHYTVQRSCLGSAVLTTVW